MSTRGRTWRRRWEDVEEIKAYLLSRRSIDTFGCWIWESPGGTPYPTIRMDGERTGVHNAALWVWKGQRSNGRRWVVMHSCDNPRCFNPDHLTAGSQRDNVHDAIAKRRRRRLGELTVCKYGHALTEINTYWYQGHQRCRACHARIERQRRADKKVCYS